MRRGFGLLAAMAIMLALQPLAARADGPAEIRAVIMDQVAAFAEGDASRAFGYATPKIQSMFGSSDVFMAMVEQTYSALIRPKSFEIEDVRTDGDKGAARAAMIGADGRAYRALYPLVRQPNGAWRIDGCFLEAAAGRSL